jgi:hypothetical protein
LFKGYISDEARIIHGQKDWQVSAIIVYNTVYGNQLINNKQY